MGLLGHAPYLSPLSFPNHLLPSPQTSHRFLGLQTQKSRFLRSRHIPRFNCFHPRTHLSWRRRVRMGLVPCGWHARCRVGVSHWIRRCGMEVCFPADRAHEAFDASEFGLVDLRLVPFGNLFLYECIFLADLFPGCAGSVGRCFVECGTITSSFAPSDRNGRVCWACCPKVFPL